MLATTQSPWRRAMSTSERCPAWRLPIVGTNATRSACARRSRSSSAAWMTTIPVFLPVASAQAEIEELALAAHAGHPLQQQVDMARIVDEIEALAVDDQQWRVRVAVKKARIGIGEPRQVLRRDRALEVDAAPMHALDQRRHRCLKINDEIGRGRLRLQMRVDLLVERVFVVGQIDAREQRILVEQKIGDRRPAKKI